MNGKYGVFIRQRNGILSDRINDFVSLHILDTLNDTGSWSMQSVSTTACPFEPGMGIIVVRNNVYCYSGIVEQIQDVKDAITGLYSWQVQGVSDLGYLDRRICYVDPATGSTTEYDHYVIEGKLPAVVEDIIQKNLGVDAMAARKEPIVEANPNDLNYGPEIETYLRFQNLLTVVKAYCTANNYCVRPVWDPENFKIYFEVFQGRDLSNGIVFTEQLNNISESERISIVPGGNYILAGGTGEMTERQFAEAENDESISQWGRIEIFQDARNQHDVESYVEEVLTRKSEDTSGYSVTASDADNAPQYGADYVLGDYVSMKIGETYVAAQVQQCQIDVSEGTEAVSPKFGTIAIGRFKSIYTQLDNLREDVDELLGTEIE